MLIENKCHFFLGGQDCQNEELILFFISITDNPCQRILHSGESCIYTPLWVNWTINYANKATRQWLKIFFFSFHKNCTHWLYLKNIPKCQTKIIKCSFWCSAIHLMILSKRLIKFKSKQSGICTRLSDRGGYFSYGISLELEAPL